MVFLVPSTSFVSFFTSFLVFLLCKKKQSKKTKKEVKQLKLCLKDTVVVFFVKILTQFYFFAMPFKIYDFNALTNRRFVSPLKS